MLREDEYLQHDALGLAALVKRGETTPAELLECAIARIERHDSLFNAIVHRDYDSARARANTTPLSGVFGGVPFLLKDLAAPARGLPMTHGNGHCRRTPDEHDCTIVARMRLTGLNILGRTASSEFGQTPYTEPRATGPCRNPHAPNRTPGGSSGGAAAAVAAGYVPMAHGSDGGGSIRVPASCTGLFGYKPSRGRVPNGPRTQDVVGSLAISHVITRSVRDSAAMLDALSPPCEHGPLYGAPADGNGYLAALSSPLPRLRIAMPASAWLGSRVDAECVHAQQVAARRLQDLGHRVEACEVPGVDWDDVAHAFLILWSARAAHLAQQTGLAARQLEPATALMVAYHRSQTASQLTWAVAQQERLARTMAEYLSGFDALLTPTLAAPPVRIGELAPKPLEETAMRAIAASRSRRLLRSAIELARVRAFRWVAFTAPFNLTGQPAMSLPLHRSADGLPIGVQLAGRYGQDALLLRLAAELESAGAFSAPRAGDRIHA